MNNLYIPKLILSPQALDAQSTVRIDEWVVLDSQKHQETDEYYSNSKKMLQTGVTNSFLRVDNHGRVWVIGRNNELYPYHYECGNKHFGLRVPALAAN